MLFLEKRFCFYKKNAACFYKKDAVFRKTMPFLEKKMPF